MELKREVSFGIDLSSSVEVLSYAYNGVRPIEVIARVDIGSAGEPLAGGGGIYQLLFYIDGVEIAPSSDITLASGKTRAIMVSRPIPLETGDVVSIKAIGQGSDTAVGVTATLRDATPVRIDEVTGGGEIAVDHNYTVTDALQAKTAAGAGVDGVVIKAYLAADWNAGNRGREFVVAEAVTVATGRWQQAMMLDPGSYVLLFYKQGVYKAKTIAITVA